MFERNLGNVGAFSVPSREAPLVRSWVRDPTMLNTPVRRPVIRPMIVYLDQNLSTPAIYSGIRGTQIMRIQPARLRSNTYLI